MNIPCDCSCKELIIFIVLKLYHTSYSEESMWEDNRMADPICLLLFSLNMAPNTWIAVCLMCRHNNFHILTL